MIRASTSPSAAQAFMVVSSGQGMAFQRRTVAGGVSAHTSGGAGSAPRWVQLVRVGHTITASSSSDGIVWRIVGSATVSMAASVLVGLAVTNHDVTKAATATFDRVAVTTSDTTVLPVGWTAADIGAIGVSGSAGEASGTFTVKGAGSDVWGTADAFHYAYRAVSGDATIVARVASLVGAQSWAKAGVMIRASTAPGSTHAFMLQAVGNGFAFQRRTRDGGLSTNTAASAVAAPAWVKLVRRGNLITASVSADGVTWTVVGSDSIPMAGTALIGLAVGSHDVMRTATGTFDRVQVSLP